MAPTGSINYSKETIKKHIVIAHIRGSTDERIKSVREFLEVHGIQIGPVETCELNKEDFPLTRHQSQYILSSGAIVTFGYDRKQYSPTGNHFIKVEYFSNQVGARAGFDRLVKCLDLVVEDEFKTIDGV